ILFAVCRDYDLAFSVGGSDTNCRRVDEEFWWDVVTDQFGRREPDAYAFRPRSGLLGRRNERCQLGRGEARENQKSAAEMLVFQKGHELRRGHLECDGPNEGVRVADLEGCGRVGLGYSWGLGHGFIPWSCKMGF